MERILSSTSGEIEQIVDYANQLARLTRLAWTGSDGVCYFPYAPLTGADFWQCEVTSAWRADAMRSFALECNGEIVAHAALVRKSSEHWELGRWVAFTSAPRGAVTRLCEQALRQTDGLAVHVECTQAHTGSQAICERLGLRFAGVGILGAVGNLCWDIVYYDSSALPEFTAEQAQTLRATGNPLGRPVEIVSAARTRLEQIGTILTCERGGALPPTQFHVLEHRLETVRKIIKFALE